LRLGASEIEKLRKEDLNHLLKQKKLILILDLDHTLINSTRMIDVIPEEHYLMKQVEEGKGKKLKLFSPTNTKLQGHSAFINYVVLTLAHAK
jgi:TFIIF-interacting CTD phosphatase-like protein